MNNCLIETSVGKYGESTNPFYRASYDLIKDKSIWTKFNTNWTEKLALVYSWMPTVARANCELETRDRESFEACIQRRCKEEVLNHRFNLARRDYLVKVNWEEKKGESLIRAYNFLSKVTGQIGASKLLHFSFPSLCLMWDTDQINWLFRTKNRKQVSGRHYVEYHRWAKQMIDRSEDKNSIIRKYREEFPRIFDICVLAKAKKRNKS